MEEECATKPIICMNLSFWKKPPHWITIRMRRTWCYAIKGIIVFTSLIHAADNHFFPYTFRVFHSDIITTLFAKGVIALTFLSLCIWLSKEVHLHWWLVMYNSVVINDSKNLASSLSGHDVCFTWSDYSSQWATLTLGIKHNYSHHLILRLPLQSSVSVRFSCLLFTCSQFYTCFLLVNDYIGSFQGFYLL